VQYWTVKPPTTLGPLGQLAKVTTSNIESTAILKTLKDYGQQRLELLKNDYIASGTEVEDDETIP
jgi:hypothetical protein